jgi:nucleotide-binding universal stress UspA family protein
MTERTASLRIWVALDQSPRSAAALDAAAGLAAELDAELAGLFVEDINLQRLIGLPFAREFSLLSGGARPLTLGEMERAWRRDAEALQQLLSDAAARQRLRWSFRVARGRLAAEVDTLAQALDLVVLGQRCGAGVRTSATTRPRQAPPQARPVLVLFEDPASSARCLDAAVRLARRSGAGGVRDLASESEGPANPEGPAGPCE